MHWVLSQMEYTSDWYWLQSVNEVFYFTLQLVYFCSYINVSIPPGPTYLIAFLSTHSIKGRHSDPLEAANAFATPAILIAIRCCSFEIFHFGVWSLKINSRSAWHKWHFVYRNLILIYSQSCFQRPSHFMSFLRWRRSGGVSTTNSLRASAAQNRRALQMTLSKRLGANVLSGPFKAVSHTKQWFAPCPAWLAIVRIDQSWKRLATWHHGTAKHEGSKTV